MTNTLILHQRELIQPYSLHQTIAQGHRTGLRPGGSREPLKEGGAGFTGKKCQVILYGVISMIERDKNLSPVTISEETSILYLMFISNVQSLPQAYGHFLANGTFSVFHLRNMPLWNSSQLGRVFLEKDDSGRHRVRT